MGAPIRKCPMSNVHLPITPEDSLLAGVEPIVREPAPAGDLSNTVEENGERIYDDDAVVEENHGQGGTDDPGGLHGSPETQEGLIDAVNPAVEPTDPIGAQPLHQFA